VLAAGARVEQGLAMLVGHAEEFTSKPVEKTGITVNRRAVGVSTRE
jgi:hypothetical protein